MSLSTGARVGRYEILALLGAGGMGEVYRALDTRLKREVALKVLPPDLTTDADRRRRFLQEAQSAAALAHPRIAAVYDADEAAGVCYLAMELVAGAPLTERLRAGPVPAAEALALAGEVGEGLAYAHAKGIVHRDLKPGNVMVDPDGHARLIDFGLAKLLEPVQSATTTDLVTRAGSVVGTAAYMAPEQARGAAVDARADVFSFGLLLYELLTGQRPFDRGSWPDTVAAVLRDPVPPLAADTAGLPGGVLPALQRLLDRCLAKETTARPASMAEVVREVETIRRLAERGRAPAGAPGIDSASIVVLPFENLSPDPDNAFFADGLTEEIIADLSKIRALRVISRTSAMKFKGARRSVPEIARDLSVRHVLEGSVRRAGNNLRITAQLIDAATDAHLWAEKYAGTLDDVFDLQERISHRIVEALKGALSPDDASRLAAHATTDPRVLEVWLHARHDAYRLTREGIEEAIRRTGQALEIFGDHALLHAADGVFHYFAFDFGFSHTEETLARCETSAARALELNPDLPQALLAKGLARYKRGDMPEFVRYLRRAVHLERNGETLFYLAFILAEGGRMAEARRYADEAAGRDPLTWLGLLAVASVDLFDGQFDAAVTRIKGWTGREKTELAFSLWWLGYALACAGKEGEAIAAFERGAQADQGLMSDCCELGARAFRGERETTREWLESREPLRQAAVSDETFPQFLASCLARVAEYDRALDWLEQAIRWGFTNHRFLSEHNRFLAPLRGDPRFETLMEWAREKERALEA